MSRRILIVPQGTLIDDKILVLAALKKCSEIADGIPPNLVEILKDSKLPLAYEEPNLPVPMLVRDLATEIDQLIAEIDQLIADIVAIKTKIGVV